MHGTARLARAARLHGDLPSAAARGFAILAVMTATFGLAMSLSQTITTNFFADVLGLAGPQFGYITAIREVPGFLLIFLTALFYRLSLPRLTALALVVLAAGYGLFTFSSSFWTVAPWVVISSMGYHTVLQTQYALGLSLTTETKSGSILGRLTAINYAGALVAMTLTLVAFNFDWISFRGAFLVASGAALAAAAAVFGFPNLRDGVAQERAARREPIVLRRDYRFYYYLSILDGARMQIFFSFGLWVLVNEYGLDVPKISALLIAVTLLAMVSSPWVGRMVDLHGERRMLSLINVGYVVALAGYALVPNAAVAVVCYLLYTLIMPLSSIGAATYLRKVAVADEIAPSLAMGLTLQHAAAIVVPVTTGVILNYVGFQIPFLIAAVFASCTFLVTRRLDPANQKSPARLAQEREEALVTSR